MDPDVALRLLRECLAAGDIEGAWVLWDSLNEWVNRPGFEPSDPNWRQYQPK
jgi:hypothetical protein